MKILKEFQAFVSRGNVIDLAVGVVIGGAFAKLVDGVVKGLIEPLVAIINGQGNTETLVQGIGSLGGGVLNFLLLAAVVFFVFVKPINKLKELTEKKELQKETAPKPPTQEELLTEIRDLLKNRPA
jgi:large conductance mechanosensitive channel